MAGGREPLLGPEHRYDGPGQFREALEALLARPDVQHVPLPALAGFGCSRAWLLPLADGSKLFLFEELITDDSFACDCCRIMGEWRRGGGRAGRPRAFGVPPLLPACRPFLAAACPRHEIARVAGVRCGPCRPRRPADRGAGEALSGVRTGRLLQRPPCSPAALPIQLCPQAGRRTRWATRTGTSSCPQRCVPPARPRRALVPCRRRLRVVASARLLCAHPAQHTAVTTQHPPACCGCSAGGPVLSGRPHHAVRHHGCALARPRGALLPPDLVPLHGTCRSPQLCHVLLLRWRLASSQAAALLAAAAAAATLRQVPCLPACLPACLPLTAHPLAAICSGRRVPPA